MANCNGYGYGGGCELLTAISWLGVALNQDNNS